jgi:hypothetical protein
MLTQIVSRQYLLSKVGRQSLLMALSENNEVAVCGRRQDRANAVADRIHGAKCNAGP